MRYLAIDLGGRRTGLATGDSDTGVVTPLGVLFVSQGEQLLSALVEAIGEHAPDAVLVGLPLNMDGSEGEPARIVREIGRTLGERTGITVLFHDERLTSFAADRALAGSGRTRRQKRQLQDALAAAEILSDFLADRRRPS